MDIQTINTPEKLHQAIGTFLQSDYSHENLIKMYNDTRKRAIGFRGAYLTLPSLPAQKDNPLDGLQDVMDWCDESSKVVDDIISNLKQQTISEVISLLKKLRGFADSASSLVDSNLKGQAQKEARAKVEKEYELLNEKASKAKTLLLKEQIEIIGKLQIENLMISRRENEDAIQIFLSKDSTFNDKLYQLGKEIDEVLKKLNELVDDNTPTGKLIDIYCKLKDIPLQRQFDDVDYACSFKDLADVIVGNCNRLYTSIDNVIKTFEKIQTKAKEKANSAVLKKPTSGNKASENKGHATKKDRKIYIENLHAGQVSLGDNAQHAGRDINTPVSENKKEKGIWANPYFKYFIVPLLVVLIGWGITKTFEKINEYIIKTKIEYELPKPAVIIRNDTEQDIFVERRAQFNIVMFSSMGYVGTEMGSGYIQLNPLGAKDTNDTTQILISAGKAIDIDAHFLNASIYRDSYERSNCHVIIVLKDSNGNITRSEAIPFNKDSLVSKFIRITFKKAVQQKPGTKQGGHPK